MEPRNFFAPVQSRDSRVFSNANSSENQIEEVQCYDSKWWITKVGKDRKRLNMISTDCRTLNFSSVDRQSASVFRQLVVCLYFKREPRIYWRKTHFCL